MERLADASTDMTRKAFIQTYGCQMNEHDSFRMREILLRLGFAMTDEAEDADLVLVNTCSVRENPENKVYSLLGRLRALKERRPGMVIGVAGCVAQHEGESIMRREPGVDLVFGPDNYFQLPEMIEAVGRGERVLLTEWLAGRAKVQNFIPEEWMERVAVDGCRGYIAITKGCDNYCSFCIVPMTRGREVSREPENILREARSMAAQGVRELWLLGQNVNSYKAGGVRFHQLLDAVSQVDGLRRIRFTAPHPKDWDDALSDLMAARPSICNQLHLPLQSGSNRILKAMRRRHTLEEYLDKVRYLKSVAPGVEIGTDLIVGFPTETEEDFERTIEALEEVRFGQVFPFKYSVRPETRAALMEDSVPREVKERRLERVIEVQERITREQLAAYVGSAQEVLIDGINLRDAGAMNGRTEGFRPVSVTGPDLHIGDMVTARITGFRNHWLEGVPALETGSREARSV